MTHKCLPIEIWVVDNASDSPGHLCVVVRVWEISLGVHAKTHSHYRNLVR
jgi:hypothetical protein